jgi:hypothetical protein
MKIKERELKKKREMKEMTTKQNRRIKIVGNGREKNKGK